VYRTEAKTDIQKTLGTLFS